MSQNCVWVRVHLVWSTKYRAPCIKTAWKAALYRYIGGTVRNLAGRLITIGGTDDHIHVYVSMPSRVSLAVMVNAIKANSTRWVRTNHEAGFAWQRGYGAFSMNLRSEGYLRQYIDRQEMVHRRRATVDEYLSLASCHGFPRTPELFD